MRTRSVTVAVVAALLLAGCAEPSLKETFSKNVLATQGNAVYAMLDDDEFQELAVAICESPLPPVLTASNVATTYGVEQDDANAVTNVVISNGCGYHGLPEQPASAKE